MRRRLACTRNLVAIALLFLIGGCAAASRVYVNEDADQGYYRKVVVTPMANLSGNVLGAPRVTQALVTELIIANAYRIVEPEVVLAQFDRDNVHMNPQGQFPPDKLNALAKKLGAQGLIQGTVTDYAMQRVGDEELPVVGFDLEMIDVATGNVAWRVHTVMRGRGRLPVLGGGIRTLGQLTQAACRSAVADLRARALR